MPEQDYQWPPSRRPFESEEDWLVRLEEEINAEYQRWLGKIASGNAEVMIEIAEWITADEATKVICERINPKKEETDTSIPDFRPIFATIMSNLDQQKAAVRNGDQDAVNEYAEDHLLTLKFNTMHENDD